MNAVRDKLLEFMRATLAAILDSHGEERPHFTVTHGGASYPELKFGYGYHDADKALLLSGDGLEQLPFEEAVDKFLGVGK